MSARIALVSATAASCYLAPAGRRSMRTGFSKFYPVGAGLLIRRRMDEVLAALDAARATEPSTRAAREARNEFS